MPLLNTKNNKDLLGNLISDLVLGLLSYVAENEFEMIRSRQKEGILLAKKRGVIFGRPKKEYTPGFETYYELLKNKKITKNEILIKLNINIEQLNYKLTEKENKN